MRKYIMNMEVYVLYDVYRDKCIVFSPENIEQKIRDYITKYSDTTDWTKEDWDNELNWLVRNNHTDTYYSDDNINFSLWKRTIE